MSQRNSETAVYEVSRLKLNELSIEDK